YLGVHTNPGLPQIAIELTTNDVSGCKRAQASENLYLLVDQAAFEVARGGLQREHHEHVQQVILDDVPNGTDFLVEAAPPLDTKILRHGDLNAFNVVSVPQGLEVGVGETEIEQVLDCFLTKEVVDAENGLFVE